MNPECIFYAASTLLEGPCWDKRNGLLYFVSIEQCLIYSLNIKTAEIRSYKMNGQVGCVAIDSNGFMIAAEQEGIFKINPATGEKQFLAHPVSDPEMRYNDGRFDPVGRFLVGNKGLLQDLPGRGQVISFYQGKSQTIISETTISNGLGFSKTGDTLFFIDTPTQKVGKYAYDLKSGEAIFDRYIIELTGDVYPDGMCVDTDEMIWVAEWGGGKVCKWNPGTGKKIMEIQLPCLNVTSCCVGGSEDEYLFITTAKKEGLTEAYAGGLFQVRLR